MSSDIPGELLYEFEDGLYLGSCDWGHCDREQAGWALGEDGDWLAICHRCAHGDMLDPGRHRIVRYVSFQEAEDE